MPVTSEKFDQLKIDKLKHFLEEMVNKGHGRPFEIFVDNLKVVPKTEDVKEFDNYEYYMNEDTEKIRILIYNTSLSPRNDQYCFYVQQTKNEKQLNGASDLDGIIQEKLSARDREHEMNELKKELEDAKEQLEEAEEYNEQLQQQITELKENKFKIGKINYGELASVAIEGIIRRNPQFLTKIPGGEALAGIIQQDNLEKERQTLSSQHQEQTEASFQKKNTSDVKPDQQQYLNLLQQLDHAFKKEDLQVVMQIIQKFVDEPPHLKTVAELLNIQTT